MSVLLSISGVIIFDECHKAKHLVNVSGKDSSQTGKAVEELQNRLPNARVVYASATGASEPRNMAYMNRLGLWGEGTHFRDFAHFLSTVEKRYETKLFFFCIFKKKRLVGKTINTNPLYDFVSV